MSPSSFLRRAAAGWQIRTSSSPQNRYSENGDTLVEVLAALVVLGIAAAALLFGFATSITASAEHRNLASLDSSVRLAANQAIADVQQEAGNAANDPFLCPPSGFTPTFANLTGSYTVTSARAWWNGTNFASTNPCAQYQPQQYTLTVSSGSYSSVVTTVIFDPSAPPSPNGVGVPAKLVWLQQPTSGTVDTPVTPQPEVAVEDSGNNIVSSDLSSVTLQLTAPAPGHLSTTCSGVESYGIVQFSDCSLSAVGTYGIKAVDSNSAVTATSTASVTVTAAPPAKFVFTSAAVSGTASNTATLGLITVTEEDAFNNPTNVPETINLSSSSSGGVFSLTSGGAATSQVSISGGASSVSFYYGDTVAGSPTIQAASPVGPGALASGQQVETIKAGAAAKLAFTSSAFSAGSSNSASAAFTVSLEDTYNNVTTKTASTTLTLSSNSGTGKFAATSGGTATTTVSIPANQSSVTAYYGDPTVGTPTITASSSPLTPASQLETITVAPTKLVFTTPAVSGNAAKNASLGPITVTEEASNGALTTVGMTVNLSSSSTGTYVFSTTNGATTPTGATSVTIPSGHSSVTFYYGDTKAGTPTITAAATGLTPATQAETVTVGPVTSFVLTNPGTQTAGAAFSEAITAVDAVGNTVTTYSGANCLTFSGPASSPNGTAPAYPVAGGTCAAGSSSLTFTGGSVTTSITLYDAQTSTALAVVDGLVTGNSGNFAVNAGGTTKYALSTPSPAAGTAFNETITATDNYGNTTTGYAGNKCVTFSGPSKSPNNTAPAYPGNGGFFGGCGAASQVAFANGVATPSITLYDAQTTTLTATATGAVGTSASFAVSSGAMKTLTVANPGTQVAGVAFNVALTGTDNYGNNASGTFSPTFSNPANSPNGTAPTYPGSVTFTNGAATANITLYDAQSTTLKVTQGGFSGTSSSFTVGASNATTLTATSGSNQSAAVNNEFTNKLVATATDTYGNDVSGLVVTFAAPSTGASATFAACNSNPQSYSCTQTTGANGQATSSFFTANGTNGSYNISATAAGPISATYAESNKSNQTITFTSTNPSPVTVLSAPYTPTATATSGLTVAITLDATSTGCTLNAGVVTFTAAGTCKIDANQAGNAAWNAAPQVQQSITVNLAAATVSISNLPASGTYGGSFTPTYTVTPGDTGATSVTSNSATICTVSGSTVNYVGIGTCSLTAHVAATTGFAAATGTAQTFTIGKAALTITANNSSMTYGTTPPAVTYTPTGLQGTDTVASIGLTVTCTTSATNTSAAGSAQTTSCSGAASTTHYTVSYVAGTMTVNQATQTVNITSTAPTAKTYSGSNNQTYTVTDTGGASGNPVTLTIDATSTSGCTIAGSTVSYGSGAGTCTVDANQAGNTNYSAAAQVQQFFNIGKAALTITANNMSMTYGTTPPAVTYTPTGLKGTDTVASIGLTVTCTTSATNTSTAGSAQTTSCSGAASTTNYTVSYVAGTMTVNQATATVSISNLPASGTYGGSFTPTYTVTPGDTGATSVTSNSATICTVSGSTVNYVGIGTCSLTAHVAATTNYTAATGTAQTFTIGKAALTITANNSSMTYGTTPPAVTYTPTGLQGTDTVASIGLTVTCTTSATNTSAAGSAQTTSCSGAASTTHYTVSYVAGTMTVNQATQTVNITSTAPTAKTYSGSNNQTYTVTDTGGASGNPVTLTIDATSTSGCTIAGSTVSYGSGAGTCTVDANQAGNTNYSAAAQVQQFFNIGKAALTITANNMSMTYGTTPPAVTYTPTGLKGTDTVASIGLTVTCTTSATNTSTAGSAQTTSCSGAASTTNYTVSYVAGTMTVNQATATVSISNLPASGTYGGSFTPTYTVTPGDTGATSVTSNSATICTVSGSTVNYVGIGTCSLTAHVAATTNYTAATGTAQTFTIGKAALTITANNSSMTYGTTPPAVTYTPTGLQGTDTVASIGLTVTCTTSATKTSASDSAQTTSCSGAASTTNYTVSYVAGTMTVQTAPTAVALTNGGTARQIDAGDTAVVTFSSKLNATTICSAWTNSGTQTVTNATITFTSASNNDTFAVTSTTSCTGNGNFGTVTTGGNYVSGTVTFTNSTITWNPATDILTFKLGTVGSTFNRNTGVTAGTPGYTASANVTDSSGIPVSTTAFTSGSTSGF